jgi:multidrug efflux system outer membrane protein
MKSSLKKFVAVLPLFLTGCISHSMYTRPAINLPSAYRGESADGAQQASFGDAKWWDVFQDEKLRDLIRVALQQNYDVRIAASRIVQAQALWGVTRADQFPVVTGGAGVTSLRSAKNKLSPAYQLHAEQIDVSVSWELDFWGKLRNATESARAQLLATEWGRRAVMSTLVANVASGYFQLRELDLELAISKRALASRQDSLRLVSTQEEHGDTSLVDVRQAEQLVYTASSAIPDLERQIQQEENYISVLLGQYPGPIARGQTLTEQAHLPEIPAGLPSSLLQRRPDIVQAEEQLQSQHAQIEVARAAFYPQIALTGSGGTQSSALLGLFTGPSGIWNVAAALTQPIFTAGKLKANLKLAQAQQQEAGLEYQQIIQESFREASDALVAYQKSQEFRGQLLLLSASAADGSRLSALRYKGGATSYLEVLTSETTSLSADISVARARLSELDAMVQLYKALGGGWQEQQPTPSQSN